MKVVNIINTYSRSHHCWQLTFDGPERGRLMSKDGGGQRGEREEDCSN